MKRIGGGWIYSDNIKWFIIIALLATLFYIGVLLLFRNTQTEGFSTEQLKYINERSLDANQAITLADSENGYYVIERDATTKKPTKIGQLPYGYYKVDDNKMSKIPYGFTINKQGIPPNYDVEDQSKLIPKTNTMQDVTDPTSNENKYPKIKPMLITRKKIGVNSLVSDNDMDGYPYIEDIPEGFYKIDDQYIGILPPNTKPNIKKLLILGTRNAPKLIKVFNTGYVNEPEYYNKQYRLYTKKDTLADTMHTLVIMPDTIGDENEDIQHLETNIVIDSKTRVSNPPFPLPNGVYYTEPSKINAENKQCDIASHSCKPNTIQFLPYGKLARELNGTIIWGYYENTHLISKDGSFKYDQEYKDIKQNVDVTFHDSIEDIKAQNDMYDISFGSIRVIDQEGNVVILPRSEVQGDITYHQPGSYLFGSSTYVPKYEDSVYLSRTSHMPTMASFRNAFNKVGFCEADKQSPNTIETKCNALDVNACGSTTCCVLLGGSKCVSGNETGPALKQNYGDIFVRNKDFYTHMGKCYGNCE